MTEVIEAEAPTVYCAGCGDRVASIDEKSNRGPCCHNLPERWSFTSEGFYNGPPGAEDKDDETPTPPTCHNCGRHAFDVIGAQQIDASEYDGDDDTILYHDPWEADFTITCAHCGTRARHIYLEPS